MITEVMIHPKCFDKSTEISDLSRVIYDIKFSKNIFIIGFQGNDIKKYIVQNYIEKIPDQNVKKRVIDLLNIISKRILKRPFNGKILDDMSYCTSAIKVYEDLAYELILSKEEDRELFNEIKDVFESINNISIEPEKIERWKKLEGNAVYLLKREKDYENLLGNILKNSNNLMLIDSYMKPNDEYKPMIEICASLLSKHFTNPSYIEFHISYKRQNHMDDNENEINFNKEKANWEKYLNILKSKYKHTYKLFYWDKNLDDSKLHDRYIITNLMGIGSQHSFGESENQETRWSLLDEDEIIKHKIDYGQSQPKFKLKCAPVTIIGI